MPIAGADHRYNLNRTDNAGLGRSDAALLEKIRNIVIETGAYQLLEYFRTRPSNYGDCKQVREALTRLIPESSFYGEETLQQRSSLTWLVDSFDGTTNYLSGYDQ